MGKLGSKQLDNRNDTTVQGNFLYPDGSVRWGLNVRTYGIHGVAVESGAEVDVKDHFKDEVIAAFNKAKEETAKQLS